MTRRLPYARVASLLFVSTLLAGVVLACSSSSTATPSVPEIEAGEDGSAAAPEVGPLDASHDAVDAFKLTGMCATTFGSALTVGFGRIDGTVYAVQKPSDTMCVMPNSDHVIVQVLMNGAVYRLVANVQSDRPGEDPEIRIAVHPHALPAPAFAEGWHLGAGLDYVTTLGAHSDSSFTSLSLAAASAKIADEVKVGALVSIYGTVGAGRPESAHLIHRNATNMDGAIVVDPTTAPRFMIFHFDDQTF
jgi:hypothetical protein